MRVPCLQGSLAHTRDQEATLDARPRGASLVLRAWEAEGRRGCRLWRAAYRRRPSASYQKSGNGAPSPDEALMNGANRHEPTAERGLASIDSLRGPPSGAGGLSPGISPGKRALTSEGWCKQDGFLRQGWRLLSLGVLLVRKGSLSYDGPCPWAGDPLASEPGLGQQTSEAGLDHRCDRSR